tara:strand:+ start:25 stop:501 length:477 start_codon:yes stop_codon:yes gene_type:complete
MNNTIKPHRFGNFKVQKDAPSTAKQVVKDAPSTEILESGKPEFSKDDKAAKQLYWMIQLAYDDLVKLKIHENSLKGRPGASFSVTDVMTDQELSDKIETAYEHYDDLVDMIVKITKGNAPSYYTDPQTVDLFESAGHHVRSMTYNEMAEFEGSLVFGD